MFLGFRTFIRGEAANPRNPITKTRGVVKVKMSDVFALFAARSPERTQKKSTNCRLEGVIEIKLS